VNELDPNPLGSRPARAAGASGDGGRDAGPRAARPAAAKAGEKKPTVTKASGVARKAISVAGVVAVVLGVAYTLDCRRFASGVEHLQSCYAFGGSIAGVGVGFSGARSSGFEQGFNTYNPSLRQPTTQRRKKEDELS
jgi:hypothetical protein